jgi:hypothetical protein
MACLPLTPPEQAKATHLYNLECQPQTGFVLKLPLIAR